MVEEVLGLEESQQDYNASEDDNIIAQGVIGTSNSWGFFGFAYYQESADSLKVLAYDGGEGCVAPSVEAAQDGSYGMTRPLYIYVRKDSLDKPQVAAFVTYYLETVNSIIAEVGYIPEPDESLAKAKATLQEALDG
jgi:phosphate transport system substrate-binding protein